MSDKNERFVIIVDDDNLENNLYVARIDLRMITGQGDPLNEKNYYCRAIHAPDEGISFKKTVAEAVRTVLEDSNDLKYKLEKVEFETI